MIVELLQGAQRIDGAIARKFGPTYNGILGIGLVIEIVRRLHEFGELPSVSAGALRAVLAVALFVFLLLHQISELAEHIDRRRGRARTKRKAGKR
jgi:hypothetical protein